MDGDLDALSIDWGANDIWRNGQAPDLTDGGCAFVANPNQPKAVWINGSVA